MISTPPVPEIRTPAPRRKFIKNRIFQFFDFLDPAPVFEVSDMALSIAEVWDFYLLLNATFFFDHKLVFFHRFFTPK